MLKEKSSKEKAVSRRTFLKGAVITGVAVSIPCQLLSPKKSDAATFSPESYDMFRNACPRNCYDTCSVVTGVKDGIVQFVEGADESTFTHGGLCVKGYSYTQRPYSADRIKTPMIQDGRRSGKWRSITWDEAMDIIAKKILDLKAKDGNLLGMVLDKYSGNFNVLNYCVEGMFSSLGYTSRFVGTPCWPAGIDAQNYDFGDMWCNDPEDMVEAKYIIVWGANPAWCSVHSMKYIFEAKRRGAKLVVIDPMFTQTSAKADLALQPNVATDGALALGMAKHILDMGLVDKDFVKNYSYGYEEFVEYLNSNISVDWAAKKTGIPADVIREIAVEFATADPATIWIGYGMQRHVNGGASVRSIDALVAMTGNVGKVGGGARYGQLRSGPFSYYAMNQTPPKGSRGVPNGNGGYENRSLNMNKTAQELLDAQDPPISLFWSSCRNPFAQDSETKKLTEAFDKIDLVVSVEQFFTETVSNSDIVLPTTTLFEEWGANVAYWHYWLSVNEPAIDVMYDVKSNLEIAAALSRKMNELEAGSCTFAQEINTEQWLAKEFNQTMYKQYGIQSWTELLNGPKKMLMDTSASWADKEFLTPSGKYEFYSALCKEHGHNALPVYVEGRKPYAPYPLLTPHSQFSIHSQFVNLEWMQEFVKEPFVYINPLLAADKEINDLDTVEVFNELGTITLRAKITNNVPDKHLLMYTLWFPHLKYNVQNCLDDKSADMGKYKTGAPGVAIHGQFADIKRIS